MSDNRCMLFWATSIC